MPEGPSLVILKEKLQPFVGQKIIMADGYAKGFDPAVLIDQTISDIRTWGKNLIIIFRGFSVRVHLGLFGSYKINHRGKNQASLFLQFEEDELNFYIAHVKLITDPPQQAFDWTTDVMNKGFDAKKAREKLMLKPERLICDALIDQRIFAGSGNIVKNEVLFRTRVHPESKIAFIPTRKLNELISEVVVFCKDFYEWRKAETLRQHLEAHEKQICPRNKIPFIKADLGKTKRHCYYCSKCQKLYDEKKRANIEMATKLL